ncbi:tyrosine-protein phosphatase non-receptor type 23 isoform X1 [Amyelois transitella]|uniref:tyrosine-protein phosphatase non-receptor type 23 isoform X1 n=1 Tax=Amyelois transitella TaxID=680683 RepID=UPI0029907672|nr:tyrosine-protein phosphatase non-receptor type 23 isoform X1 [Amyelois transitella]
MEAVPKLPMLSFELKSSPESTHFGPKLKQYISEVYREDPDSYSNEMHQLEGLRSAAVRPISDITGLSVMNRYFCQLRAMQSRFPMAKGQPAACTFVWKDLYANMNCSLADLRFEMACILHNIGALLTQLAASEPRTTADSLKAACTRYQNAAWAFQYVREQYPQPTGVDLSSEILRLFQEICFAQAQECILDKSIQDTKKPSVVGAVATQVLIFYRNSMGLLGPSAGADTVHEIVGTKLYNYWYRYLQFKCAYIGSIVCLYQGMHAEEQQKMGERVAFYQQAVEKLAEARKLAKYIEPVQITQEAMTFTNDVVEGKRKAAKNENEFIYHEEVPDKDLLTELKPVCLVKSLPINYNDPDISGPDIFSRLVPMGAHEASSLYSEEKAKLLRQVMSQVDAKNTELMEFMSSLQLDQLEVIQNEQKIPQEIVDRCAAMNAKQEVIQTLVDSMNSLAETISDVEHMLTEIKTLIQEDTRKEKEFQQVMGPRPPSLVQTEYTREYHKYQEAHSRTTESNQVLHKAMTLHIANLRLLAQPLDVLQAKIPSVENIEGLDRETMMEMRRVVGKAKEMQTQRDSLVQQFREAVTSDDITAQLLARSSEDANEIFKQEIEKHTPKVKIIEQNLAAQENIINRLTSLYASYGESRRLLTEVLRKREGLINALITSYDTYEELLGKSQKGQEFYKKLSHNMSTTLNRLRGICQVQDEERTVLLAKQSAKTPPTSAATTPALPTARTSEATTAPSSGSRKLKDYLPYMKNRSLAARIPPAAQIEAVQPDSYYPESIYPTSVRPAPLGSEATDLSQMPDGVVPGAQNPNPYMRYNSPYAPSETDSYVPTSSYGYPKNSYEKPEEQQYNYSTSYTPPQFSTQMADPQIYSNPYYSATQNNTTAVTDSQNTSYPNVSQANMAPTTSQYGTYTDHYNPANHMSTIPEAPSVSQQYPSHNQDFNTNFAQMHVSGPKQEPGYGADYSQTYYSVQYPQNSTHNMATYSHAPQNSNTNMTHSQIPTDYNSLNYPYSSDQQYQANPGASTAYSSTDYANYMSQAYPVYTNSESIVTSTTSVMHNPTSHSGIPSNSASIPAGTATSFNMTNPSGVPNTTTPTLPQNMTNPISIPNNPESVANPAAIVRPYNVPGQDPSYIDPNVLSQLDAFDKPIKSHVRGEALSATTFNSNFPSYPTPQTTYTPSEQSSQPTPSYPTPPMNYNPAEQSTPTTSYQYTDQTTNYVQTFQNHPGYNFNAATGAYEYSYGSQNSYSGYSNPDQVNINPQSVEGANWSAQGVYTSAGGCDTVQSPSEAPQGASQIEQNNQTYYNAPYGYQTTTMPSNEVVTQVEPVSTNYGADVNQSTYMQSGQAQDTSVTFSNNQVTTPKEEMAPPNFEPNPPASEIVPETPKVEEKVVNESVFDLLSDIDFTVEHKPLQPEIKVPQISESALKKHVFTPKPEIVKPVVKEEVIERPPKRDIFADPGLLNKFTQEVKNLQMLVDSLTNVTQGGMTVLDAKWKKFQEVQTKENMTRSKTMAMRHCNGNIVTEVVPYDDSRLTLKSDPDAYINASYYKQLTSWCIPLVISKTPSEEECGIFWKAVLEYKIACIVCLLSEIEMQGKFYWPTAKGQSLEYPGLKVTLDDVTCTVHWTERKLRLTSGSSVLAVTHFQINVFPAKIVCSPLVLLVDKVLSLTSSELSCSWLQCAAGAGRSALLAALLAVVAQIRSGGTCLIDILDEALINLCKHRSNVLEDTKFVADAYRTALFFVQGVLCSGTTMFNGEAVSFPSGAGVLPPVPPAPAAAPSSGQRNKFSRESFEEMKQSPGLKSGDMKDPLNFLDPLWSLKKK